MVKHFIMLVVILQVGNSSLAFAKNLDKADYLANYVANWEKAKSSFADCQNSDIHNSNFIFDECPTANAINLYYVTSALLHFTAASLLPEKYADHLKNTDLMFNLSYTKNTTGFGVTLYY